ncbi:MAG: triose-phosphate isomerase [Bacteroidota bacterium]|jgi:triosephosphate isomerase
MKNFLIAGNWKMNTTTGTATELVKSLITGIDKDVPEVRILVCPPFTNISSVAQALSDSPIAVGAQNCHFEYKGAFTGEISIPMLIDLGCSYIIIGHSERRTYFHETNDLINKKAIAILTAGLKPIICIGETLDERTAEHTFMVLEKQLSVCLQNIEESQIENIVIAYEPVWAIGTGISATSEQVAEAHTFIREQLINKLGKKAESILILYGGSLTAENAKEILKIKNVNGGLIGGASLKAESFLSIISSAQSLV